MSANIEKTLLKTLSMNIFALQSNEYTNIAKNQPC